jgi:hypothetical protein
MAAIARDIQPVEQRKGQPGQRFCGGSAPAGMMMPVPTPLRRMVGEGFGWRGAGRGVVGAGAGKDMPSDDQPPRGGSAGRRSRNTAR